MLPEKRTPPPPPQATEHDCTIAQANYTAPKYDWLQFITGAIKLEPLPHSHLVNSPCSADFNWWQALAPPSTSVFGTFRLPNLSKNRYILQGDPVRAATSRSADVWVGSIVNKLTLEPETPPEKLIMLVISDCNGRVIRRLCDF